ncbi:hypothetical protein [Thermoactinospora rubra]|uniref:hypothetical protein n=1 Tax=Thermoactinospora rubra TaxID=1088767 RepID=UPI000A1082C2|nr:hypothetical protein [Thermoactinospora rubra]
MSEPIQYQSNRDEAAAKRSQAAKFDEWAEKAAGLVEGISRQLDGQDVWSGPAADAWEAELNGPSGITREIRKYPEAYRTTARNMRETARKLMETPGA